jgi:glycosyltransferase A (GT-A) superfamily protein (DUF2064 family)
MARAPRRGETKMRLEPVLGVEGCERLQRALIERAGRWAAAVGEPWIAYAPDDARDEVGALAPQGARLIAQEGVHPGERIGRAFATVCSSHGGPSIVIGTDQPALGPSHASAVLDDLREGVDVCLGPATDGGWYLLAAPRPHPALFGIDAAAWGGPAVMSLTLQSLVGAGLSMGWLRSERNLDDPVDAAALLADPCAQSDIVAALGGRAKWHPAGRGS